MIDSIVEHNDLGTIIWGCGKNDRYRQQKLNGKIVFEDVGDIPDDIEDIQDIQNLTTKEILNILYAMSDEYRTIFNLHTIEGYTHAEISGLLNISESVSESQYAIAKHKLLELLKNK